MVFVACWYNEEALSVCSLVSALKMEKDRVDLTEPLLTADRKNNGPPKSFSAPSQIGIGDGAAYKKPFQPFQSLSKFIDSLPLKTNKECESVPPLVTRGSKYKKLSDELIEFLVHNIPNCFSTPLRFFWNDEITIAKRDGKELMAGNGRLGQVFLGYNQHDEWFALKYFNLLQRKNHRELADALKEAALQDKLAPLNLTPAFIGFAFIMNNTRFFRLILISRFIPAKAGCLRSLSLSAVCIEDAARRRNGYPPLLLSHQYLNLLSEIANQLTTLADCQVIHSDMKYDNIILYLDETNKKLHPYIVDFGSGFMCTEFTEPLFKQDTVRECERFLRRYRQVAPEFLYDPKAISSKSDLYGVGLMIRGIGIYLDIPALVCFACKLRSRNPDSRPDYTAMAQQIRKAFGKDPVEKESKPGCPSNSSIGIDRNNSESPMKRGNSKEQFAQGDVTVKKGPESSKKKIGCLHKESERSSKPSEILNMLSEPSRKVSDNSRKEARGSCMQSRSAHKHSEVSPKRTDLPYSVSEILSKQSESSNKTKVLSQLSANSSDQSNDSGGITDTSTHSNKRSEILSELPTSSNKHSENSDKQSELSNKSSVCVCKHSEVRLSKPSETLSKESGFSSSGSKGADNKDARTALQHQLRELATELCGEEKWQFLVYKEPDPQPKAENKPPKNLFKRKLKIRWHIANKQTSDKQTSDKQALEKQTSYRQATEK